MSSREAAPSVSGVAAAPSPRTVLPGSTLGIIGGGQLGQMIGAAAVAMGLDVVVLDPTPACPASRVGKQIVADYDDAAAVRRLAEACDVLTYEFENVSADTLSSVTEVSYVPQGTAALEICQDRRAEKQFLRDVGVPIAPYALVDSPEGLEAAAGEVGFPSVLKTVRGGYDGKGQLVLRSPEDLTAAASLVESAPCVLESWIDFTSEISVIVAGNPQGQYVCFPVGENIHVNNILHQTIVPARVAGELQASAQQLALRIAEEMRLLGVMGVEMFIGPDSGLVVNELAPRPHNSGHYSIEGCSFSQFEAHVRGVCGWPLVEPELLSPAVMTNILGEHQPAAMAAISSNPKWAFHLYGKAEAKEGRKMGHVTRLAPDTSVALAEMETSGVWT